MRQRIVAGNWKMNNTIGQGILLLDALLKDMPPLDDKTVILCPPFIHLAVMPQLLKDQPRIHAGAQNIHFEQSGAYTGEVSASMVTSVGCEYVILGHSERRQYFGETDETVLKKIHAAQAPELKVIYCCGEPKEVREAGKQEEYVLKQLQESIFNLDDLNGIVIAYEPIWAIGTGLTASPEQAQDMHAFIRSKVGERFDADTADYIPILYGGSVKPNNAEELFGKPDVDGGLIGGASLKAEDFLAIIKAV